MSIEQREQWNKRAKEFQSKFLKGENEYNKKLFNFWIENGMIEEGIRTLDIGCGVGRHGVLLGNFGCEVSLVDISDEMLRYAGENMKKAETPLPFHLYRCNFAEVTGEEDFFKKGFNFSLASMSPAISDYESVKKMSDMTQGCCFVTRFVHWDQPLKEEIISKFGLKFPENELRHGGRLEDITDAVKDLGYELNIEYTDYNWSDEKSPETLVEDIFKRNFPEFSEEERSELKKRALEIAKDIEKERGTLHDEVLSKVVWLYWKTV